MMQEEEEPETEPNVNEPTKKFIKELINQINNSNTDHNLMHIHTNEQFIFNLHRLSRYNINSFFPD